MELHRWGEAVGEQLAALGALDHFSIDALARRFGDRWSLQAIEVNLRKGGTTHPHQVLRFLSHGKLDPAEPSNSGTSAPFTRISTWVMPVPARAARRCSTVARRRSPRSSVVQSWLSRT